MGILDVPGVTQRTFRQLRRRDMPGTRVFLAPHRGTVSLSTIQASLPFASSSTIPGGAQSLHPEEPCFTYLGCSPQITVVGGSQRSVVSVGTWTIASPPPFQIEFAVDLVLGQFEVAYKNGGAGDGVRVLIDDVPLTKGRTFMSITNDGSVSLGIVSGLTPRVHRVRLECDSVATFVGLNIGLTDSVIATERPLQRWVAIGDSFTEPTVVFPATARDAVTTSGSAVVTSATAAFTSVDVGSGISGTGIPASTYVGAVDSPTSIRLSSSATNNTQVNATANGTGILITLAKRASNFGWANVLGRAMGVDMWCAGSGGTGYLKTLASPARPKFRDRLAEVIAYAPDGIVWAGGLNDYATFTAAQIGAEALLCYQAIRTALPNCQQVVVSPFWPRGHITMPADLLGARDAIKAAAQTMGLVYIDTLTRPLPIAGVAGTLAASASVAATTVSSTVSFVIGSLVQIGTGASSEIRRVGNVTGSGPYTITISDGGQNINVAHASGEAIANVGEALFTGTGTDATLTTDGNSVRYTSNDATHPTPAGHVALGYEVFDQLAAALIS